LLFCKGDVLQKPELFEQGALVDVMKDGVCYRGGIASLPQRDYRSATMSSLTRGAAQK
jgi:hypothetical protein